MSLLRALVGLIAAASVVAGCAGPPPDEGSIYPALSANDFVEGGEERFCDVLAEPTSVEVMSEAPDGAEAVAMIRASFNEGLSDSARGELERFRAVLRARQAFYDRLVQYLNGDGARVIRVAAGDTSNTLAVVERVLDGNKSDVTALTVDSGTTLPGIYALDLVVAIRQSEASNVTAADEVSVYCTSRPLVTAG